MRFSPGLLLALLWAAQAQAQTHLEMVCPCRVETPNLTSVDISFGVRNLLLDRETGPLRADLEGRLQGGNGDWRRLATVQLPSLRPRAGRVSQEHRVAFRQPAAGTWELRLRIIGTSARARDTIYWLSEPVSISRGGGSYDSAFLDGTPTLDIAGASATLKVPALKNPPGGTHLYELSLALVGTDSLELERGGAPIATWSYGQDLPEGSDISAAEVTLALDSPESHDYLQLQVRDRIGNVLAYETVAGPDNETLPVREIATADADILVDSDQDGVSDVNERLMGTDADDAGSTPDDPEIDVLALYSPGYAQDYGGDPSTRIRHVITLADTIFRDSEVNAGLRLVGLAEIELSDLHPFTTPDEETAQALIDLHGADVAVMFRPLHEDATVCGWAYIGGHLTRGTGVYDFLEQRLVHVFSGCGASAFAHEIGHVMGLAHSYVQDEVGTYRWSRGYGIRDQFVTVMAYRSAFGFPMQIDRFSSPDEDCAGFDCGVPVDRPDGADAVTTLNATRFQVANFAEARPDTDGDGFVDPVDALPEDPGEQFDFDGDGAGDNADTDDDNDGVADGADAFPFDPTEWVDIDGDGSGDNGDVFPLDRFESGDSDGDGVGNNADRFPDDPGETVDTDNDGVGNNADPFPFDTREWSDTDGDGTGDNADADDDNDGVADIADHFPLDPSRTRISSYRFVVTDGAGHNRRLAPAGDIDGDGKGDFLIGLVDYDRDAPQPWSSTAYLVAAADLAAADAADGAVDRSISLASIPDQPRSWKFVGERDDDLAGHSVGTAGDIDGDGRDEVIIGAPAHDPSNGLPGAGAAYVVSFAGLGAADAADGKTDGEVNLGNIAARENSWKIIGENGGDSAGGSVGLAGDFDGDGKSELLVGARDADAGHGAVYVLSPAQLSAADRADWTLDGVLSLGRTRMFSGFWKLTGAGDGDQVGGVTPSPGQDNAGNPALLVTAGGHRAADGEPAGAVYLVSSADLASMDAADGASDGAAGLARAAAAANSWQFIGESPNRLRSATGLGDIDGDDVADIFIQSNGSAFLVSGADLAGLDGNGDAIGVIQTAGLDAPNSWQAGGYSPAGEPPSPADFDGDGIPDLAVLNSRNAWLVSGADLAEAGDRASAGFAAIPSEERSWRMETVTGRGAGVLELGLAGDVDGDGLDDTLAYAGSNDIFLLLSADLGALDDADARTNGLIELLQLAGDSDGDGIEDIVDGDDDDDGYLDYADRFPRDAAEWSDADGDGTGDNGDAFPHDKAEQFDTDGDGIGDNADTDDDGDGTADESDEHPLDTDNDGTDNARDEDDDGDGVADAQDLFPLDPDESADTDGDGTGNNADTDDDGDGTADADDAFPYDPEETADADGDGVGDNADAFPNDAAEWNDSDGDGTGNNADTDDDGDGTADADDAFPYDPEETADADGDGVGDNADAFPNDAAEWTDSDGDGTGDNADTDDDGDQTTDGADLFPLDPERARLFHYRLSGEHRHSRAGGSLAAGDLDGDGRAEALIGAPGTHPRVFVSFSYGAAYGVSVSDLPGADRADGVADHGINLGRIAAQPSSNTLTGDTAGDTVGESIAVIGNGSGDAKWLAGAPMALRNRGEAYLVSPPDLETADALDGVDGTARASDLADQPASWVFMGESRGDQAGRQVAAAGDVNGDGFADLLIGSPRRAGGRGAAYLVSGTALALADPLDGDTDGRIWLGGVARWPGSWQFIGEPVVGLTGWQVAPAGDTDGDGLDDVIVGAPYFSDGFSQQGAVYLIAAADLAAADAADGASGGVILLENMVSQSNSWKLVGEAAANYAGWQALTGDTDGDGELELIVGAPGFESGSGAVYVLPVAGLPEADRADGVSDGTVDLDRVAQVTKGYKFTGDDAVSGLIDGGSGAGGALAAADLDGDGVDDLVVGAPDYREGGQWCPAPGEQRQSGAIYVVSGAQFAQADGADGEADGAASLANIAGLENSWQLLGEPTDRLGAGVSAAADLDGDGRKDLILGGPTQFRRDENCGELPGEGVAVMISSADLPAADRRDGAEDGVVYLEAITRSRRAVDFDFDGTEDALDEDDDNDGTPDTNDAFPFDPYESADSDHDGIGDNADSDDDNDGTRDAFDAFPFDPYETADSDGDGTGDNADTDDDNADSAPDDPAIDTDGDGIADAQDSDDDGDGVADSEDLFPLNGSKSDFFFYRIEGDAVALKGTDFDGDGRDDLATEAPRGDAYLLSSADLNAADSADGDADRVLDLSGGTIPDNSWLLIETETGDIFPAGDVDSDGLGDLIVEDLLVSASSLAAEAEAYSSTSGREMRLTFASARREPGIRRFESLQLAWGVYSTADLNADGHDDILVGARLGSSGAGGEIDAAYVVSGADLPTADSLDGADDGEISLDTLAARAGSWKIVSETETALGASIGSAGDVDGDGHADLMIGAPHMAFGSNPDSGSVIILSGASMESIDAADGETDGTITITQGPQDGRWKLGGRVFEFGSAVSAAGDADGDGFDDVLIKTDSSVFFITGATFGGAGGSNPADFGSKRFASMAYGLGLGDVDGDGLGDILLTGERNAYLLSGDDLPGLGAAGGVVYLESETLPRKSWRFTLDDYRIEFQGRASAADLDGDGMPELVLPVLISSGDTDERASYILSTAELAVLDTQDPMTDGVIRLDEIAERWSGD